MRTALLGVHGERSLYTHGLVPVAIRDTIALRSTPLGLPDAAARGRCYSLTRIVDSASSVLVGSLR